MHILHVACMPYPSLQGSQVYLRGLLRAQAQRSRVSLLCYGHGLHCTDEDYRIIRVPNIGKYRRMRAGPDWYKPLLDCMIAARLWKEDADIIHVHNYEAPFAAYLCRIKNRIPIVYTAHNLMEEELQTYFSNPIFRTAGRIFGAWLDHNIPRRADAAVSIREQTAVRLSQLGCNPVFTILPGVEELAVEIEKRKIPTVIYAGNLDNYQDLEIFVRLAQNLSEIQFRIVTSSRPEGGVLNSSIDVIHTQDFQEVCLELAQSHLCVVPRKICSGFPMKILNALALGVPVIAFSSAVPPMEGVIRVGSYHEMEAQIQSLVYNPAQCETLGRQGKKIVLSEYAWEKRAIEFEKIYNYLINEKNRRKS